MSDSGGSHFLDPDHVAFERRQVRAFTFPQRTKETFSGIPPRFQFCARAQIPIHKLQIVRLFDCRLRIVRPSVRLPSTLSRSKAAVEKSEEAKDSRCFSFYVSDVRCMWL